VTATTSLRVFHRTSHADAIMRDGFRDGEGSYGTSQTRHGVWVSDVPLDVNEGAVGDDVLAVEIPEALFVEHEWVQESSFGYREALIPAESLNAYRGSIRRLTDDDLAALSERAAGREYLEPEEALIAHEEAHATVARALGWIVLEVGYSERGGRGWAYYAMPSTATPSDELCVTLAGPVMEARTIHLSYSPEAEAVSREVMIGQVMRAAKRNARTGFAPKTSTDTWKAALLLVSMQPTGEESFDAMERDLREAWERAAKILDAAGPRSS
jgi:hypothetical protein